MVTLTAYFSLHKTKATFSIQNHRPLTLTLNPQDLRSGERKYSIWINSQGKAAFTKTVVDSDLGWDTRQDGSAIGRPRGREPLPARDG